MRINNEIAKNVLNDFATKYSRENDLSSDVIIMKVFSYIYEQLDEAPHWRDAEKHSPKFSSVVIAYTKDDYYTFAKYDSRLKEWKDFNTGLKISNVIAWMVMPSVDINVVKEV